MSVRLRRLQAEYERLRLLFEDHPRIRIVETAGDPPDRYTIEYRIKGLVQEKDGINVREVHRAKIMMGPNFPKEMPQCVMLTSVFHPNIDHLAICTEDIGSAGQTVDQLITFIGEMITYQAYNIQSPRNGEAAQWARDHAAEFPLEHVDLTPTLMLEGDVRMSFAAEATKPALASECCANCGTDSAVASLQTCSSGHLACPDCVLECANCRKLLCVSCELTTCSACRRVVCGDCSLACPGCGHAFCLEHVGRCAVCSRYECSECAKRCSYRNERSESPQIDLALLTPLGDTPQESHETVRPPEINLTPAPALAEPQLELQQFAVSSKPLQAGLPPEGPQVDVTPVPLPAIHVEADHSAPSESLRGHIPSGNGSLIEPDVAQDIELHVHVPIVLTSDEVARVPESAIARPPQYMRIEPRLNKRLSGKAIVALIFGITGIPLLGILLGWFAILFAGLAKRDFRSNPSLTGRPLATTALVLGIVDILLWAVLIAVNGPIVLHHVAPLMPSRAPDFLTLYLR